MNFLRKIFIPFRLWRRGISLPLLTTVYGVSNPNSQGALAQSRVDDQLQIVHTPTERHKHNVYVYSIELNRILGYIEKELAKGLVAVFGNGFCLDAVIEEIVGGTNETDPFGAQIIVLQSTSFMLPYLNDLPHYHEEMREN